MRDLRDLSARAFLALIASAAITAAQPEDIHIEKVMLQFRHSGRAPTLAEAAAMFDLKPPEVDPSFGVIATDPGADLYTILIDPAAVPRAKARVVARGGGPEEGIFSSPRIEPTNGPN